MSNKILIIGQAPPAQAQKVPYDTTMLYDWLALAGSEINKNNANDRCDFFAVCDVFTGFGDGGHLPPNLQQMTECYERYLRQQIAMHQRIWIVGAVAKKFLQDKIPSDKTILHTIHPSKRCYNHFMLNKDSIISQIKVFLNSDAPPPTEKQIAMF